METEMQEMTRRLMTEVVNSNPRTREEIEQQDGKAWDTEQLCTDFEVLAFRAPYALVIRRSDKVQGWIMFQHAPRFYFAFEPI